MTINSSLVAHRAMADWTMFSYRANCKATTYMFYPNATIRHWRGWDTNSARNILRRKKVMRLLTSYYSHTRVIFQPYF